MMVDVPQALITGGRGLVGSEAVESYDRRGFEVHGVDNNMRLEFFGPTGDTVGTFAGSNR